MKVKELIKALKGRRDQNAEVIVDIHVDRHRYGVAQEPVIGVGDGYGACTLSVHLDRGTYIAKRKPRTQTGSAG